MAGRDSEVTNAGGQASDRLFTQIRNLFRFCPINNREFASMAPNVAATLYPADPLLAYDKFVGIVEYDLPPSGKKDALRVLLGLDPRHRGNVLERKVSFAPNLSSITVARWADEAIADLVAIILRDFAEVHAWASFDLRMVDGQPTVQLILDTNALMDPAEVELGINNEPQRLELEVHHPHQFVLDGTLEDSSGLRLLKLTWTGAVQPHMIFWPRSMPPEMFFAFEAEPFLAKLERTV